MHHDADSTARIMAAADELFEQGNRAQFPRVDAVRKAAHVSMNDATNVMKQWRRAQLAGRGPAPVEVPPALHDIHRAGLETLWLAAQEHASQSMAAMRVAWDAERAENEQLNCEMVAAFEAQTTELEHANAEHAAYQQRIAQLEAEAHAHVESVSRMETKLNAAEAESRTHAARAAEIERRAQELRVELDRSHAANAAQVAKEAASQAELATVRAEMLHLMQMVSGAIGDRIPLAKDYSERKRQ
ncbi:UNVERIFIED_ORG: plasmid replication DNA-binding protein KfrA [Zoogloea ramigera]|uniref:DNA-binding protein n=1 Tax=Duganella zoogloeoides TaxID=75659 RepID=A0ABZ0XU20_9BURK|nr:DNA-binding protein [Duganella zoogloeoides]WQH02722.1 DNA-binding protein [Duganella zoogloeoides]